MSEFSDLTDSDLIIEYLGSRYDLCMELVDDYQDWLTGSNGIDAPPPDFAPARQATPFGEDMWTPEGYHTPEQDELRASLLQEFGDNLDRASDSELLEAYGGRDFVISELEEDEDEDW